MTMLSEVGNRLSDIGDTVARENINKNGNTVILCVTMQYCLC